MSKTSKVAMADVLIRAGYNKRKSIIACGIPLPVRIEVTAEASESHLVVLVNFKKNERKTLVDGTGTYDKKNAPIPLQSFVESSAVPDAFGVWSIDRSNIQVTYPKSINKLYFGNASSGTGASAIQLTHRISIPMAPGWPNLKAFKAEYPPPKE